MKIVAISDTHTYENSIEIPPCDLLICAGDISFRGRWIEEVEPFLDWFVRQPAKHKVLVAGNHEVYISQAPALLEDRCKEYGIHYLRNSHVVIEGKKIFGSPYSVKFGNWAYGLPDDELQEIWNMIDSDTEIVVCHGPPKGILDTTLDGDSVGSETLWQHLQKLEYLRLFVCGHIHEDRGMITIGKVTYANAAICSIPYSKLSPPISLELPMIEGVYYVPVHNEVVILHKVDIKLMANTLTGEVTNEVVVTLEGEVLGKKANVMISKENLRQLEYIGPF